ncbi:hypothetical protein [Deinococcus multiflagellatus]|uniref:DUF4177 domain-containing protein n=1 Tax=Deinococcus multiflagellatus TaxID=1656887 RepID=A0ABW1ZF52_9DEIO|nr:hypothetical protein [Deinococcus multiflagellatus]MBZ9712127.1 hypothetical protein [Deinococcus multiflagellatus]
MEFHEFAQTRAVIGSQAIASRDELRAMIEQAGAWGWSLPAFQERVGVRLDGDTAYVTEFSWAHPEATLADVWAELQAEGAQRSPVTD